MEIQIQELTDNQLIEIIRILNGHNEAVEIARYLNFERGYCFRIDPWAKKVKID